MDEEKQELKEWNENLGNMKCDANLSYEIQLIVTFCEKIPFNYHHWALKTWYTTITTVSNMAIWILYHSKKEKKTINIMYNIDNKLQNWHSI